MADWNPTEPATIGATQEGGRCRRRRHEEIDAAYEAKYGHSPHVAAINAEAAKATTICVVPG